MTVPFKPFNATQTFPALACSNIPTLFSYSATLIDGKSPIALNSLYFPNVYMPFLQLTGGGMKGTFQIIVTATLVGY